MPNRQAQPVTITVPHQMLAMADKIAKKAKEMGIKTDEDIERIIDAGRT